MAESAPRHARYGTVKTQGDAAGTTSIPQPPVDPESPTVRDLKRDLEHVGTMLASNTLLELVQNFKPRRLAVTASRCTYLYVDNIVSHTTEAQVQHLFSTFGQVYRMQGPQPYINRYTNSILQRAYVDFQDARSALMAFNCFYDEDFSAAAHKLPEVQHGTNAKWPVGKLVVILGEYLPALSTTVKKQQQSAGPSQSSIGRPDHVYVEPQHVFSGPSRNLFQQLLEDVEAFHQQQAMSRHSIMQRAMRHT